MPGKRFIACLLLLLSTVAVHADEQVRQVQEELRRRNLYFGDIDGTATPELGNALRRYQARKGIEVTGAIDDATAASLDLQPRAAKVQRAVAPLPDVPVLRSDSARVVSEQERIALEKQGESNPEATQSPAPPAEAPAQNMTPERVGRYVEQYLRDSETSDIGAQVKYFSYPV